VHGPSQPYPPQQPHPFQQYPQQPLLPPKKKHTGLIITSIFTALVLVGAGVAEALLIKKDERAISHGKQYSAMFTPIALKTADEVRRAIG